VFAVPEAWTYDQVLALVKELSERNAEQARVIAAQCERIAELERRLAADSSNSSRPRPRMRRGRSSPRGNARHGAGLRTMLTTFINTLMSAEADAICGAPTASPHPSDPAIVMREGRLIVVPAFRIPLVVSPMTLVMEQRATGQLITAATRPDHGR
jgi:hypothetical protein